MVMEVVQEDMGDGSMQCTDHPYKSTTTPPGGICAFCLQEKLGKLVSSSFPSSIFPSSSSSPSPNSFRSEIKSNNGSVIISQSFSSSSSSSSTINNNYHSRRSRIPFLITQKNKNKKKKDQSVSASGGGGGGGASAYGGEVFRRSKSTTTPRRSVGGGNFVDVSGEYSPRKRGFWSFLSKSSGNRKIEEMRVSASGGFTVAKRSEELKVAAAAVVEENESPEQAAFERKVSRSRSVGCGSRSFSGDFFERISTGFGDCTLRRVESQREANNKPKNTPAHHHHHRRSAAAASGAAGRGGADCIKERVKCGGIFSGFTLTSSSSSSSSSSYLVSSSDAAATVAVATPAAAGHHGRSKSWGWAFASPMRALNKTSSSGKRESSTSNKNSTPNLTAIPSLLAIRG